MENNLIVLNQFVGKTIESYRYEEGAEDNWCDILFLRCTDGSELKIQSLGDDNTELVISC
jgi:hypothetical protein